MGTGAGLDGARDATVLADPTDSGQNRRDAGISLAASAALFGLPAAASHLGSKLGNFPKDKTGSGPHDVYGR